MHKIKERRNKRASIFSLKIGQGKAKYSKFKGEMREEVPLLILTFMQLSKKLSHCQTYNTVLSRKASTNAALKRLTLAQISNAGKGTNLVAAAAHAGINTDLAGEDAVRSKGKESSSSGKMEKDKHNVVLQLIKDVKLAAFIAK